MNLFIIILNQSLLLHWPEESRTFPPHYLHYQAHLLGYQLIFRIGVYVRGIPRIIVLYHKGLYRVRDELEGGGREFCVVFGEGMERLKQIFMLIYCVVLHEIFVFLYNLAHEGLHRLKEVLARYCHVLEAFA